MGAVNKEDQPLSQETVTFLAKPGSARSHRKRPLLLAIGRFNLFILCTSLIALLSATTFLYFLWAASIDVIHGKPAAWIWFKLVQRTWLIRAVTISSVVLRTGVAAQAGVITPMIASLLLERAGTRFDSLAMLSVMRCTSNAPQQLLQSAVHQILGKTSFIYIMLLCIALAASIVSQFSSTILLLDFSDQKIVAGFNSSSVAYGLHFNSSQRALTTDTDVGINYWLSRPSSYPRFAEWSQSPIQEDGLIDTGPTYRAFLPFTSVDERERLRKYTGAATVMDLRVACVRPQLVLTDGWVRGETIFLSGTVQVEQGRYSMLSGTQPEPFNCTIALDSPTQRSSGYWKTSICDLGASIAMQGGIRTGASIPDSYILFNVTGSGSEWLKSGKFKEWANTSEGAWTTMSAPSNPTSVGATICLIRPYPYDYQVNISSNAAITEPSLGWDNSTGRFITRDILSLYGANTESSRLDERGVLILEPHSNWTEHAVERTGQTRTYNFVWMAVGEGFTYGNKEFLTKNKGLLLTSHHWLQVSQPVHRAHIAVFQDALRTTRNPALAIQTLFTILSQAAYYDFLPQFDVASPAVFAFSRHVTIPHQWIGFYIVVGVLGVHLLVLVTVLVMFLSTTKASILGNAWQVVGQVVELVEKDVLGFAGDRTDKEMRQVLKASGRGGKVVKIS